MIRRTAPLVLALALAGSACAGSDRSPPTRRTATGGSGMQAFLSSTDLYVGAPQRVGVGLPLNDGRVVSFGGVSFSFSFLGGPSPAATPSSSPSGPSVAARYVPTPGTPAGGSEPRITQPTQARGIYEADGVTFDRPGYWRVTVTADVDGSTARAASAFAVLDAPSLPAPGEPALRTENLTMDSKDAAAAIDSRAVTSGEVPDPELHRWTIADAIRAHRPVVVVFATPQYCQSEFCGPVTDAVDDLARDYEDRAVFIHVEIYHDYTAQPQEINKAAADWLLRDGDLTEPWLYLIGGDGTILDRWSTVFDPGQVASELRDLPRVR